MLAESKVGVWFPYAVKNLAAGSFALPTNMAWEGTWKISFLLGLPVSHVRGREGTTCTFPSSVPTRSRCSRVALKSS